MLVLCNPEWLETFDTDRRGERVVIVDGCLSAAPGAGFGVRFGEAFGVVDLVLVGIGDLGFVVVLGVRGVFGVGGSFLMK